MTNTSITPKQAQALERFGLPKKEVDVLSFPEAKSMLDILFARASAGLATYKQVKTLSRFGLGFSDLTFDEARRLIEVLHKHEWRLPDGNVWELAGVKERAKP